ncbi:hypothetical protein BH09BAC4_BH09BAC4_42780 [soil metagenome]
MQTIKEANQTTFVSQEVVLPGKVEPSGFLIRNKVLNQPTAGQVGDHPGGGQWYFLCRAGYAP